MPYKRFNLSYHLPTFAFLLRFHLWILNNSFFNCVYLRAAQLFLTSYFAPNIDAVFFGLLPLPFLRAVYSSYHDAVPDVSFGRLFNLVVYHSIGELSIRVLYKIPNELLSAHLSLSIYLYIYIIVYSISALFCRTCAAAKVIYFTASFVCICPLSCVILHFAFSIIIYHRSNYEFRIREWR